MSHKIIIENNKLSEDSEIGSDDQIEINFISKTKKRCFSINDSEDYKSYKRIITNNMIQKEKISLYNKSKNNLRNKWKKLYKKTKESSLCKFLGCVIR